MKSKLSTNKTFADHLKDAKKLTDKQLLGNLRKEGFSFDYMRGFADALKYKIGVNNESNI